MLQDFNRCCGSNISPSLARARAKRNEIAVNPKAKVNVPLTGATYGGLKAALGLKANLAVCGGAKMARQERPNFM